jgi:predicted  nucleic acid-binding Zn-ribbon protein
MLKLDGTVKCDKCGTVYALAGNQRNVSGCPECGSHSWTISLFEPNKFSDNMNQVEIGQYIVDEFTDVGKKVIDVHGIGPLSAKLMFQDGTFQIVNGKFAADVLAAEQSAANDKTRVQ